MVGLILLITIFLITVISRIAQKASLHTRAKRSDQQQSMKRPLKKEGESS